MWVPLEVLQRLAAAKPRAAVQLSPAGGGSSELARGPRVGLCFFWEAFFGGF